MNDDNPKPAPAPDLTSWRIGLWTSLLSLLWLIGTLEFSTTFGSWQGAFLDDSGLFTIPLLSGALHQLLRAVAGDAELRAATAFCAILGAISCGLTAWCAAWITRDRTTWLRWACGFGAGATMAVSTPIAIGATMLSPSSLTLALGLGSLAALIRAQSNDRPWRLLALSGSLAGLATANHPSFAILLPALLLFPLSRENVLTYWPQAVIVTLVPFVLACSLPIISSWSSGAGTHAFWEHALRTPYPILGEARPDWNLTNGIRFPDAWPVVFFAAFGLWGAVHNRYARSVWTIIWIALLFGPFLPALIHHPAVPSIPVDEVAATGMFVAAVCVLAARGIASISEFVARTRPMQFAVATIIAAIGVGAYEMSTPDRTPGLAASWAQSLIEEAPDDSILICGNIEIASLLRAAQLIDDVRTDVIIIPPGCLTSPSRRAALADRYGLAIETPFPEGHAWAQWARERPNAFQRLIATEADSHGENYFRSLDDLAQWDLVVRLHRDRAVCFAGHAPEWVTARARRIDTLLAYPQDVSGPLRSKRLLENWSTSRYVTSEYGVAEVIAPMLSAHSQSARAQGRTMQASFLAVQARLLAPRSEEALLAELRAAARRGDSHEAGAIIRRARNISIGNSRMNYWTQLLKADMSTAHVFGGPHYERTKRLSADEARNELNRLWAADEIYMAERLSALATGWHPGVSHFLYDHAAALAQLGRIPEAEAALGRWVDQQPISWELLQNQVRRDGRFVMLDHLFNPADEEGDEEPSGPIASGGQFGNFAEV